MNHKVKIFIPCQYGLSQVETYAPFLDRYGGVVFVYDWNVSKDIITDYYGRQYPDGWVKVVPFSLRNILAEIRDLDRRLDRYEDCDESYRGNRDRKRSDSNAVLHCKAGDNNPGLSNADRGHRTRSSLTSSGSASSNDTGEVKRQHQVVFLLTDSMNPDYDVFGLMQKKILDAIKDALPERVRAVDTIKVSICSCTPHSEVEHEAPLHFTRHFSKTLPYTAQDIRALYATSQAGSSANSAHAILVVPSCGSTSMLAQTPLIQLFHRMEQTGRWRFVWKMHSTSLQQDGYRAENSTSEKQTELSNIKFVLANFTVTRDEHACLLPFIEAFDVIITELHSSFPSIATYFAPNVILSYLNDANHRIPESHQKFIDQLNTFRRPEDLEALLTNLPQPKGDSSLFHSQYGHVDGLEDLRFGNLVKWPMEQIEPSRPYLYRQAMAQIALEWRNIYRAIIATYPDDIARVKNALGFDADFELPSGEDAICLPRTLPRVLPRERRAAGVELKIMTFNIWNGGMSGNQPLEQTAKAILASGADIVGLQECSTVMEASGGRRYMLPELMQYLPGWYYSDQKLRAVSTGPRNPWGVVSKFPIIDTTERGFGVKIQLNNHRHPEIEPAFQRLPEDQYPPVERSPVSPSSPIPATTGGNSFRTSSTRFMYLFNCHLYYFPYQPFQILGIPYDDQPTLKTADEAIQSCIEARGKEMQVILGEIKQIADQEPHAPIFLTGDFNEPSHLDWTPLGVFAGLHPMTVNWPVTQWAYRAGLVDLWRAFRHHQSESGSGSLPSSPLVDTITSGGSSIGIVQSSNLSNVLGDTHGQKQYNSLNDILGNSLDQKHSRLDPNARSPIVESVNHGNTNNSSNNVLDIRQQDKAEAQVVERPGFTWTVLKSELDAEDHYDRIDYIFGLNRESSPIALKEIAIIMGEELSRSGEKNDKVMRLWPSDHRAVIASVIM
ncbi:hypothetical protein BGZ99_002961 [Dissophora globulifera]|uniref:Endonuclease/exonuclease/phosphatase domain-containing protein n=1 Tax=Dissophora globulifera TaxID=979702 RepID=A0A9P6RRC2_9FUNG|nr:hypothetical protein BGZ99_002961 [Dissophora globulifera]